MSYLKTTLCLAVIGGLTACTAVSSEHSFAEQAVASHTKHAHAKGQAHVATVKPGASVQMDTVLPKTMTSGAFQTVQLRFNEAYNEGAMSVRLEPSEGLRLFGGTTSKTFDMTNPAENVWDVDVKADVDGVYFLNVFVEAQGQPRSFSVRLNMGTVTQKMFDDAMPADGKLMDGGKIRVLEAEETIK